MKNHSALHVAHAASHAAAKERAKGNHGRANAISMIGLGIVLMPIPFIGIPLFCIGLWNYFTSRSSSN